MATPTYYKSLDGFRALAVLMVLLIHSNWLPIGWVGVQMFFVLSGFLITGILVAQKEAVFSDYIGCFYWKRSLRIWPLYFLFIALTGLSYFLFSVPNGFKSSWLSLVTYTYNFVRISPQNDSNWFGHFWTLCIEEQFYLVWPFVVYFLTVQKLRRLAVLLVIIGPLIRYVTGVAFASVSASPQEIQRAVHSMTTSHIDAFSCGAFVALIPIHWRTRISPKLRQIFVGLVAATIACGLANSCVLASQGLPPHWQALGYDNMCYLHQYVWSYSLLNLSSAGLILCLIENRLFPSVFQHPAAVYVGTISYGIYVWQLPWHYVLFGLWPVEPHSVNGLIRFFALLALTVSTASVSFYGFERFFLKMKQLKFGDVRRAILKALQTAH